MAVILTIPERRIAEAYVPVLDYVSRCALAVDRGDWFYLYDKAAELEHAAQRLSTAAHAGHKATAEPRGAAVRAFVADRSWRAGFRAGELLHPVEGLAERRAEVVREVAEKLGDGTREHRKDDMPARCGHARKITRAVIGSFEFDGGDPPPSREEDFRPIGRGYVIV